VKTRIENRLDQIRRSRGVGASDLARRVHVSRQTIYPIEAGTYVPNTEVALNLARELATGFRSVTMECDRARILPVRRGGGHCEWIPAVRR
jgi:DNA-binding XRE family transcriptional regulator